MKISQAVLLFSLAAGIPASAMGTTIAQWTFETSQPTTAGPLSPETGSGTASAFHSLATTYSNPTGNGSAESWSANDWSAGDYWQFSVGALGLQNITVGWDQVSSGTGPGDFGLFWSTDGGTFTQFGADYSVLNNNSPAWSSTTPHSQYSFSYDLSSVAALDSAASVYFQLRDMSTTSATNGIVGSSGTDRIDNFTVSGASLQGAAIPDSAPDIAGLACALGLLALLRASNQGGGLGHKNT